MPKAEKPFSVVILSMAEPDRVARLMEQLQRALGAAIVSGVLYEERPRKPLGKRVRGWLRGLRQPGYAPYVLERIADWPRRRASALGARLLDWIHAYPEAAAAKPSFGFSDLDALCRASGARLFLTEDLHSAPALDFVRSLAPDLGVVYGTRILHPELFEIPRCGSINIHKRKVPDYRGGGPVGLWELLDNQNEIGITVHRVTSSLDAGAVIRSTVVPIEPYDNLESLAAKADVVGDDLMVAAVGDFARGTVQETPQQGPGRTFRNPKPGELRRYRRELARCRPRFSTRPVRHWLKLALKTLAALPAVAVRNRRWRSQGSFPVVILYSHLIADRPHRMGISTAHFDRQVRFLKRHYRLVSLDEALRLLASGEVRQPTVALTFDDGYASNDVNLRAVALRHRVPAALFVCTQKVSHQEEFEHDVRAGLRGFPALAWDRVVELDRMGFEIGSHTRTHFDCGSTEMSALESEIVGSKTDLEARLGHEVRYFSFPWGHPENMSEPARALAGYTYPHVFSAYGGANFPERGGKFSTLERLGHPVSLWELELQIQGALDRRSKR